ncbi:unnamed protein product, partial [Allacma fusca]
IRLDYLYEYLSRDCTVIPLHLLTQAPARDE